MHEVENPMILPEKKEVGPSVNTAQIYLGDDFYAQFRELNERLAAESRERAERKVQRGQSEVA